MEEKKSSYCEKGSEAYKESMETCRQELLNDGWKEDSREFKSLMALHDHLISTTDEELQKEWAEVEEQTKGIEGPTVEEYFESINPQAMYAKGYREGALRYKTMVEEYLKGIVAQKREKQRENAEAWRKKFEERRRELGFEESKFIPPDPSSLNYHPGSIEDFIELAILPEMQNIFDNN